MHAPSPSPAISVETQTAFAKIARDPQLSYLKQSVEAAPMFQQSPLLNQHRQQRQHPPPRRFHHLVILHRPLHQLHNPLNPGLPIALPPLLLLHLQRIRGSMFASRRPDEQSAVCRDCYRRHYCGNESYSKQYKHCVSGRGHCSGTVRGRYRYSPVLPEVRQTISVRGCPHGPASWAACHRERSSPVSLTGGRGWCPTDT
ncbi:hypothetical protein BT67DRAFT_75086 [Trichocladium antarcticum]|uniref:Uncharacterized protein n=1 Tax=Trichocladium antarcticum TaxID=1450529 RepID=A0AAN6UH11_9PEZI|nr:hypothetical protein BT67DRAFT_75086 [Trichocladium antarcticum]